MRFSNDRRLCRKESPVQKTAIYDLDGTVIYTPIGYIQRVISEVVEELGGKNHITPEKSYRLWLETDRNRILEEEFEVNPHMFWQAFNKIDNPQRARNSSPYEDVLLLMELKRQGYKLGVLSGAPRQIVDDEVDLLINRSFGGKNIFDIVACTGTGGEFKPKPDSEGLEHCLASLGASKSSSVMVGNGEEDVLVGLKAGIRTMLVLRPDRALYPYRGVEPHRKVHTLYPLRTMN